MIFPNISNFFYEFHKKNLQKSALIDKNLRHLRARESNKKFTQNADYNTK